MRQHGRFEHGRFGLDEYDGFPFDRHSPVGERDERGEIFDEVDIQEVMGEFDEACLEMARVKERLRVLIEHCQSLITFMGEEREALREAVEAAEGD